MSSKYVVLNILLVVLGVMVLIDHYEIWSKPNELIQRPQETINKPSTKAENFSTFESRKEPLSLNSLISISEKNIFSPERKNFPIPTVEKSNPVARPQLILYGVTIAGDYQAASLVNPGRPLLKGERETITLKLGEKIGGYKLAKIQPDRIVMESNGDSFEVLLYDPRNPKKRTEVKTDVKPAAVTTMQQTSTTPHVPQVSPSTPPSVVPPTPSPQTTVEKSKEPPEQILPAPPRPAPRPYFPPPSQRRGRRPVYPPSSSNAE